MTVAPRLTPKPPEAAVSTSAIRPSQPEGVSQTNVLVPARIVGWAAVWGMTMIPLGSKVVGHSQGVFISGVAIIFPESGSKVSLIAVFMYRQGHFHGRAE